MSEKTAIDLQNVQFTLLLPLWGRAEETKKKSPFLKDETAVRIISHTDYDFSTFAASIHPITQHEWICRSIYIDRAIKDFLLKHPKGTVVNVGCGLDTTFDRVDNGSLCWYDLDLPDVIELRRKFIPETDRRIFIACSFLDDSWFNLIHADDSILFTAAGVLYYPEENRLREIFRKIACTFAGAELIFDAASPVGVKVANEKLLQKIGLDESALMKWSIQNSDELKKWNISFEYVREYPMYKNMTSGLTLRTKFAAWLADHYKMMYMIHLKLGSS